MAYHNARNIDEIYLRLKSELEKKHYAFNEEAQYMTEKPWGPLIKLRTILKKYDKEDGLCGVLQRHIKNIDKAVSLVENIKIEKAAIAKKKQAGLLDLILKYYQGGYSEYISDDISNDVLYYPIAVLLGGSLGRYEYHDGADVDYLVIYSDSVSEGEGCNGKDTKEFAEGLSEYLESIDKIGPEEDKNRDKKAFRCALNIDDFMVYQKEIFKNESGVDFEALSQWDAIYFDRIVIWDTQLVSGGGNFFNKVMEKRYEQLLEEMDYEDVENNLQTIKIISEWKNHWISVHNKNAPVRRTLKTLGLRPVQKMFTEELFIVWYIIKNLNLDFKEAFEQDMLSMLPCSPIEKFTFLYRKWQTIGNELEKRSLDCNIETIATNRINAIINYFIYWYSYVNYCNKCDDPNTDYFPIDKYNEKRAILIEDFLVTVTKYDRSMIFGKMHELRENVREARSSILDKAGQIL